MWLNQFGGKDDDVFYVFCAVLAIIVTLAMSNVIVLLCCKPKYGGATSVDLNIIAGSVILSVIVLLRGLQTDLTSFPRLQAICQSYPAPLIIGLTLFTGGLMVKSWGIFFYQRYNKHSENALSEEWKPNLWMWFLIIIAAVVSVAWCVTFTPMLDTTMGDMNETIYECQSEYKTEWEAAISAWHAFLLLGAVLAIIPNCATSRLNNMEANILSLVTVNTLFSVVAGICLYFLYDKDETVNYAINGALMLWVCLFACIMLLVSKILGSRRHSEKRSMTNAKSREWAF